MGDDKPSIRLLRHAMTPLCDDLGKPRAFAPWKPVVNACSLCPARCCRMTVRASVADVIRFCRTLDIPWSAGFRLLLGESEAAFEVETPDGPRHLAFALHQDAHGDCANLVNRAGHYRCGAYEARPSACRLYPVAYEAGERRGGADYVLCMVPYGVTEQRERDLKVEIAASIDGWAQHRRIAEAWRAHDGPKDEGSMVRFVLSAAAQEAGMSTETLLTEATPEVRLHALMREVGVSSEASEREAPVP